MSITFPTTLDTFTNPTATDQTATVSHSLQHRNINDAVTALEAKVGANSSAVTSSHDYKLSGVTGTDKAVSKTGTETLTNKTLTAPVIGDFTSATHTHQNAAGGGTLDAAAIGTGTVATARLGSGAAGSSTYLRGDQTWATVTTTLIPELISSASAGSGIGAQFINGYYMTTDGFVYATGSGTTTINFQYGTTAAQTRAITSDYAAADYIKSAVVIGNFLYLCLIDASTAMRVYRYDKTNLSAGGTLMTTSGQSLAWNNDEQFMTSDGTFFYFNFKAGNSANDYVISKYSLSGTVLTFVADITCGSTGGTAARIIYVDGSTNIWTWKTDGTIRKYNSSGTIQTTSIAYYTGMATFFAWGSNGIYGGYVHTNAGASAFSYATRVTLV